MPEAIAVRGVTISYGKTVAVSSVSAAFPTGKVSAILGPNGAGKTTLVEACEGYRRPQAGSIRVLGTDPWRADRVHRSRVGVMLQEGGVTSGATARQALTYAASLYSNPLPTDTLMDMLGLEDRPTTFRRMSGGQQQRVKFALAIIGRPELVFLDEPTAGMDTLIRRQVWDVITELRANGVTVVLTSHSLDEVRALADNVVVVNQGRIVANGSVEELSTTGAARVTVRIDGPSGGPRSRPGSSEGTLGELSTELSGSFEIELVANVDGTVSFDSTDDDRRILSEITQWCARYGYFIEHVSDGGGNFEEAIVSLMKPSEPGR